MSVITGKNGDVRIGATQLAEITSWTFTAEINILEYASNKTAGVKRKLSGSKMASGALEGVYDPQIPIHTQIQEGSEVTLDLFYTASHKIVVPVVIENLEQEVNIDDGEIVTFSADFGATGTWTYPAALPLMAPPGIGEWPGGGPQGAEALALQAQLAGLPSEERELLQDLAGKILKILHINPAAGVRQPVESVPAAA